MKPYPNHAWPSLLALFLWGLSGLLVQPIYAQSSSTYTSFDQYTVQDGLPSNRVRAFLQDSQGFIWLGTEQGLVRFNGYDFEIIDFSNSSPDPLIAIGELYEDTSERIWIGGREGLVMYDPVLEESVHYVHNESNASTLSHNNVFAITQTEEGFLWIGTERGLNRLDPTTGEVVRFYHDEAGRNSLCGEIVTSIVRDEENTIWIGTEKGLCSFDKASNSFTLWDLTVISDASKQSGFVRAMALGTGQILWIGTQDGLFSFDIENKRFKRKKLSVENNGDKSSSILSIVTGASGTLIVGTETGEIREMNVASNQWLAIDYNKESTPQTGFLDSIQALLVDKTGMLWVGTWGKGFFKQNPLKNFHSYKYLPDAPGVFSLSHPEVNVILPSKYITDHIWIGTNGGGMNSLNKRTRQITFVQDNIKEPAPSSRILALEESSDSILWVGTDKGLFYSQIQPNKYEQSNTFELLLKEGLSRYIFSIIEDPSQNIWLGTSDKGVQLVNKENGNTILDTLEEINDSLSHYTIWPIEESRSAQKLWIGTYGGGVNSLDLHSRIVKRDEILAKDSLFSNSTYVQNLHEDDHGNLWVGTLRQGLIKLDSKTRQVIRYLNDDNLSHNSVSCIQSDIEGNLWIGTYNGLSFLGKDTDKFYWFSEADGLPGNYFIGNACAKDSEGILYFGTKKGLLYFDPGEIVIDERPPDVVITGVDLYDEPMKQDTSLIHKKVVRLKHNENYLTVHFSGLHFAVPEENMYSYILEGIDRYWVKADSENRSISYRSLVPGTYRFRVKASNSDGVWSTEEASITIIIAKPYWQTWWYRLLWVLAGLVMLLSLHRFRVHHLLKVIQARQQISADLHDNMGGSLSSIALFLEGLARQFKADPSQEYRINYHAQTSRQLIDDLRDTVWVVNADYDSLPELVQRMHQLADHASTDIGVHFQIATNIPDIPLNMDVRRNLLLIYKEALYNAIRHAEAAQISITANYEHEHFSFEVLDNGIGFNPEVLHKGRGLKNFHQRAEAVKGTLEIDSTLGAGTKIGLTVRLPRKTGVYS